MNRCIFVGRLTRDPEVSFSEKAQMSIARFTVAVDRIPKREGEPEADFFNCVAFDRKAEFVEQYWYSGMRVVVSGRMQNDNYTNKKGEKVYGVSLKADDVEFADGKREADNGQAQSTAPSRAANPANASAAQMSKEAPVTRNATQAPRAATAASRAAAPATNQGAAKPAASRNTSQRQAPSRSAVGRSASQRGAARAAAGDDFMNVASGMEESLPFN